MKPNRKQKRAKLKEIKNSNTHLTEVQAWNSHIKKQASIRHKRNKLAKQARKNNR